MFVIDYSYKGIDHEVSGTRTPSRMSGSASRRGRRCSLPCESVTTPPSPHSSSPASRTQRQCTRTHLGGAQWAQRSRPNDLPAELEASTSGRPPNVDMSVARDVEYLWGGKRLVWKRRKSGKEKIDQEIKMKFLSFKNTLLLYIEQIESESEILREPVEFSRVKVRAHGLWQHAAALFPPETPK